MWRDHRTSIASRYLYDYSSQLLHQENCIYRTRSTLNASWYLILRWLCKSIAWKIAFVMLLTDFQIRYLITSSWVSSCQCRCSISWYKSASSDFSEALFLLLAWTSQKARRRLNIAMSSFLEYFDWNEFSFESYMFRLHTFDCFESWAMHIQQHREFSRALTFRLDLSLKDSIELWAMILSLNYACFVDRLSSWAVHSVVLCDELRLFLSLCLIFCDHRLMNAQFMLHSQIVCYEIHIKLAHFNFVRMRR